MDNIFEDEEDEKSENQSNQDDFNEDNSMSSFSEDDDDFGLPEVSYNPIEQEEVVEEEEEETLSEEEEKKSSSGIIILIILLILVLASIYPVYQFVTGAWSWPPKLSDKATNSQNLENSNNTNEDPEAILEDTISLVPETTTIEEEMNSGTESSYTSGSSYSYARGSVSMLYSETGRYYVVVASFFNQDNAFDHGNKLARKGINSKIIKSTINGKDFFRLSIENYGSEGEAHTAADNLKSDYGSEVWVLKY